MARATAHGPALGTAKAPAGGFAGPGPSLGLSSDASSPCWPAGEASDLPPMPPPIRARAPRLDLNLPPPPEAEPGPFVSCFGSRCWAATCLHPACTVGPWSCHYPRAAQVSALCIKPHPLQAPSPSSGHLIASRPPHATQTTLPTSHPPHPCRRTRWSRRLCPARSPRCRATAAPARQWGAATWASSPAGWPKCSPWRCLSAPASWRRRPRRCRSRRAGRRAGGRRGVCQGCLGWFVAARAGGVLCVAGGSWALCVGSEQRTSGGRASTCSLYPDPCCRATDEASQYRGLARGGGGDWGSGRGIEE